jgi:hypothetical protein
MSNDTLTPEARVENLSAEVAELREQVNELREHHAALLMALDPCQVADAAREFVMRHGTQAVSVADLARELSCEPDELRGAIRTLAGLGLCHVVPRSGTNDPLSSFRCVRDGLVDTVIWSEPWYALAGAVAAAKK